MSTGKKFDYGALTEEQRSLAKSCAYEVHEFVRKTRRDTIRVGRLLKKVKAELGHGHFLRWVDAEFGWSADTAGRLMKVAERFGEIPHAADIAQTALYLLAGDKVPEAARREALARAEAGESITPAIAREIKDKYLAPANGGTGTRSRPVTSRSTPAPRRCWRIPTSSRNRRSSRPPAPRRRTSSPRRWRSRRPAPSPRSRGRSTRAPACRGTRSP